MAVIFATYATNPMISVHVISIWSGLLLLNGPIKVSSSIHTRPGFHLLLLQLSSVVPLSARSFGTFNSPDVLKFDEYFSGKLNDPPQISEIFITEPSKKNSGRHQRDTVHWLIEGNVLRKCLMLSKIWCSPKLLMCYKVVTIHGGGGGAVRNPGGIKEDDVFRRRLCR